VAVRSKALLCSRSLAGIVGSNPSGGMVMCVLQVLCVVRKRSLSGWSLVQRSPTKCGCVWGWSWKPDPLDSLALWGGGGSFDAVLCRRVDRDSTLPVFTTRLQHKQKNKWLSFYVQENLCFIALVSKSLTRKKSFLSAFALFLRQN